MRPRLSLAGFHLWHRPILLLPILAVLLTAPSSTAPSPNGEAPDEEAKESFTLAVVRRDGIAIPFATYDGKRWKNSWPAPESKVTAPIMLTDVPRRWWSGLAPIAKWTFWPAEAADGEPRTLETIGPTIYPAHCQQGLGLRTTYSTREVIPPPHIQPYPKAGLAMSSGAMGAAGATIERIEIADIATSRLVAPLARALVSEVYEEEKRRIGVYMRMGEGWSHPYTDAERKETPLRIEALYKVARGLGDRDVFYFEGLKHYAIRDPEPSRSKKSQAAAATPKPEGGPGKEPCDLVTFVSGWVIGREEELLKDHALIKPKPVRVSVTSCDFAGASIMFPLGVVRVKDKALWAAQWSNWTHEAYQLTEVTDDNLILVAGTTGGQCLTRD